MKKRVLVICIMLFGMLLSGLAPAQTIYTDRTTFEADNPGLATEDFELGTVGVNAVKGCDAPMDATTGSPGCFAPGELQTGVIYSASVNTSGGLALVGDGYLGNTTKSIVANFFADSFIMDFSEPDNTAVGMDLVCFLGGVTATVDIYGAGGLITSEQSGCTPAGVFFGVAAAEAITSIEITGATNAGEGVDNLSFGAGVPIVVPPIARFAVTKDFSDNSSQTVDVHIICDTGLPLEQSFTIGDSQSEPGQSIAPPQTGVTFVVTEFTDGAMNCTITETPVPFYSTVYTPGGDSQNEDANPGCRFTSVAHGDINTCEIENTANPATFTVDKVWELTGVGRDELSQEARINVECDAVVSNATPFGVYYDAGGLWPYGYEAKLTGNGSVSVKVDTTNGSAECRAYESSIDDSGVETTSTCDGPITLTAGSSRSCNITNTVFFEGIPTLSQYGLALMALLMLGMGMVGFRRFA